MNYIFQVECIIDPANFLFYEYKKIILQWKRKELFYYIIIYNWILNLIHIEKLTDNFIQQSKGLAAQTRRHSRPSPKAHMMYSMWNLCAIQTPCAKINVHKYLVLDQVYKGTETLSCFWIRLSCIMSCGGTTQQQMGNVVTAIIVR